MALTAYIKPTNYCTVNCDHCYLTKQVRSDRTIISESQLRNTARLLLDLAKKESQDSLHIIWHGGEPMMLKPEWYLNAIRILESEIGKDTFTQSIQTSMVPYTEMWNNIIISKFDGFIGSSIDFSQRTVGGSQARYIEDWLARVSKARTAGITVIPTMVPTRHEINKGAEIVSWFEANDFCAFNIEKYSDIGGSNSIDKTKNQHHSSFMIEVFDEVKRRLKKKLRCPHINVIVAAINGIVFGAPGDRWGGSCQRDFVVIEPDGSTNSCPDRTSFEEPFSNVKDGASAFIKSSSRRKWLRVQSLTHKESHCHSCNFNSWCKSGCPITPNTIDREGDCSGFKKFLNHVEESLKNEEIHKLLVQYAKPLGEPVLPKNKLGK